MNPSLRGSHWAPDTAGVHSDARGPVAEPTSGERVARPRMPSVAVRKRHRVAISLVVAITAGACGTSAASPAATSPAGAQSSLAPSTSAASTPASVAIASAATPPAASPPMELVGSWTRTQSCQEELAAFEATGLATSAGFEWATQNWVPDASPRSAGFCDGALGPTIHSHFFTQDGAFGSRSETGQQVDDGD